MSSLRVGIVGLPNVGKSTLFNALLGRQQALAANYPFATIEPNVGVVDVPDERLEKLADTIAGGKFTPEESDVPLRSTLPPSGENLATRTPRGSLVPKYPPLVPATVEFVDIAGLVKGAASGEGLGNKFLTHIREVDLICHVLRSFEDGNIVRAGAVDPVSDYETVEQELILKDLETVMKQNLPAGRQENPKILVERLTKHLNDGNPARTFRVDKKEEIEWLASLFLLTSKDEIAVVNVAEGGLSLAQEIVREVEMKLNLPVVALAAKIEEELTNLSTQEKEEYLRELGVNEAGLDKLIKLSYSKLGLMSFLTAGEKEVRAWTIKAGSPAPKAAGVIHTDFEKKFIKAKVADFSDFVNLGGWKACAEAGKVRLEGKEYMMQEGDVVEFMIGS